MDASNKENIHLNIESSRKIKKLENIKSNCKNWQYLISNSQRAPIKNYKKSLNFCQENSNEKEVTTYYKMKF